MTGPKRARDVQVGDVLPDGSTVYSVNPSPRGYNIRSRWADGRTKRRQYAPETIVPEPDNRHPSRFEGGHPWARKARISRSQQF